MNLIEAGSIGKNVLEVLDDETAFCMGRSNSAR